MKKTRISRMGKAWKPDRKKTGSYPRRSRPPAKTTGERKPPSVDGDTGDIGNTEIKLYRAVLIGKPNVGKSSLLNALTHTDSAIITRQSGTTRDSINRVMKDGENAIMLSDLPGWDDVVQEKVKSSDAKVFERTRDRNLITPAVLSVLRQEVEASDIIIAVTDIKEITAEDRMILEWIREYDSSRLLNNQGESQKSKRKTKAKKKLKTIGKPIIYCANKCDDQEDELNIGEVYELGAEDVISMSCKKKRGFSELREAIFRQQKKLVADGVPSVNPHVFYPSCDYKLAIVGKPNAGKSSLFNAFLGKGRSVVSAAAGTTRDLVEDYLGIGRHTVKLIDTGGLRRKSREKTLPENFSVQKAVHAVTQSDVVILVIDAVEGLSDQDKKIAALALGRKKSLMVALNKWDLVTEPWKKYYEDLILTYPPIKEFPILPISCANRKNLMKVLKTVDGLYLDRSRKISLEDLNHSLKRAGTVHDLSGKSRVRIRYAMQVQNHPPVFYIYVSNLNLIKSHYRRYIYNYLENLYGLKGTPLTLRFFEHQKSKPKPKPL